MRALQGQLSETQRWVLKELLDDYDQAEAGIVRVEERLLSEVANNADPFAPDAMELLQTVPGIGVRVATVIIAEIGLDMTRFPTAGNLASWAGLCPGNHESAGKRSSGKTTKGNRYLKTVLVQAAWAATHTKNTYLAAQYHRLVKRMGAKKALVAVAHTMLTMVYHILNRREPFRELGGDYSSAATSMTNASAWFANWNRSGSRSPPSPSFRTPPSATPPLQSLYFHSSP